MATAANRSTRLGIDYAEARADLDRIVEGLEKRIRETEARILKSIDDQARAAERGSDQDRHTKAELEQRLRTLEQELALLRGLPKVAENLALQVTILRTTNKLLAGVGTFLISVLGLAIGALALWH